MSYEFKEYPDREMLAMDLANQIAGELRAALTSFSCAIFSASERTCFLSVSAITSQLSSVSTTPTASSLTALPT